MRFLLTLVHVTVALGNYVFEIPYSKTVADYPQIVYPKPGPEIDQMDVSLIEKPNQIRISLTGVVSEMAITWTTNSVSSVEIVKYGVLEGDMNFKAYSTSHQYDWNFQKEKDEYYYTSGYIHEALMVNLMPGKKHFYQIESNGQKSEVLSFVAAPEPGQETPISFMHIGDVGTFGTSVMVTNDMMNRMKGKDFHGLIHCGDISYADKYDGVRPPISGKSEQKVWDTWGQMVEPLASSVPYMVTPGNHEIVAYESAWENGSIYNKRFIMPGNERYYSFGVGMVFFISVSTDDDIDKESTQGTWLEQTLEDIDREKYPWVVFFQHRPIYNSNTNHGNWTGESTYTYDARPDIVLPKFKGWDGHYEDLLVKYKVDFVLTGHVHHYERTFPVKRVVKEDGERVAETTRSYDKVKDPVHITCGHAGVGLYSKTWSDYENDDGTRPAVYQGDWDFSAAKNNKVWGHCEMEFLDRNKAKHYMFAMGETQPTEEVTITKESKSLKSTVSMLLVTVSGILWLL